MDDAAGGHDPGAGRRCRPAIDKAPALASFAGRRPAGGRGVAEGRLPVPSALPQLGVKLLFRAGSAHDPKGKEGLAALAAAMIAEAGSRERKIDEIRQALFPHGGQLRRAGRQGDDHVHRVRAPRQLGRVRDDRAAACSLDPGFREEDFSRLKDAQQNALSGPAHNNEEELGKERLQANALRGHALRAPRAGHGAGHRIDHARRREGLRARGLHPRRLTVGISGDVPKDLRTGCGGAWPRCRTGPRCRRRPGSRRACRMGWKSRSSRRTPAPRRSPSAIPSRSPARTRTSRRPVRGPRLAGRAPRRRGRTCTSASARCAG